MSKIVCQVCGAVYEPTEKQCPVCGAAPQPEAANDMQQTKIALGVSEEAAPPQNPPRTPETPEERPLPRALQGGRRKRHTGRRVVGWIAGGVAVCLAIYIGYRFLRPYLSREQLPQDTIQSTVPTDTSRPCASVHVEGAVTFTAQGDSRLLSVFAVPTDTTDEMRFASSDPKVATVSDKGLVTAIGPGKAEITVTCGAASAVCPVTCSFAATPTDSTDPSGAIDPTAVTDPTGPAEPTVPIDPSAKYELNREDFTLFYRGETFRLKVGDLAGSQVTWTSEDPDVATVDGGLVTGVAPGYTTIHAKVGSQELTCIVRCSWEGGSAADVGSISISHTDVTLVYGQSGADSFVLRLKDGAKTLDVTWTSDDTDVCTVSGNTIRAQGSGMAYVSTIYQGVTYTCIVRVK